MTGKRHSPNESSGVPDVRCPCTSCKWPNHSRRNRSAAIVLFIQCHNVFDQNRNRMSNLRDWNSRSCPFERDPHQRQAGRHRRRGA